MIEVILDLRNVDKEGGETWADSPAKAKIENVLLDYAGEVIRVKIQKVKQAKSVIS